MNNHDVSNKSTNTSQDLSPNVSIIAKLRRMKIQEDLFIQLIKKNFGESDNGFIVYDLEYKKYLVQLKTSYTEIKQLFDDLKCVTKTQGSLQKIDIDEVKRDVLELDEKIKAFKTFLQREQTILKSTEQHLLSKPLDQGKNLNCVVRKQTKVLTKTYTDIIPSPVRNIINSPFKYPEVQQFQDFLSSSNKYGGWNEYNHNIFIKLWQTHFQNEECFCTNTLDQAERNMFINSVSENVAGVQRNDIISHMEWYTKYLFFKKQQQLAIDKWKAKTKPKKDIQQKNEHPTTLRNEKEKNCGRKLLTKKLKSVILNKRDDDEDHSINPLDTNELESTMNMGASDLRYTKSTKQWNNRCNDKTEVSNSTEKLFRYTNPDNIAKLGIPNWRSKLVNNDN